MIKKLMNIGPLCDHLAGAISAGQVSTHSPERCSLQWLRMCPDLLLDHILMLSFGGDSTLEDAIAFVLALRQLDGLMDGTFTEADIHVWLDHLAYNVGYEVLRREGVTLEVGASVSGGFMWGITEPPLGVN